MFIPHFCWMLEPSKRQVFGDWGDGVGPNHIAPHGRAGKCWGQLLLAPEPSLSLCHSGVTAVTVSGPLPREETVKLQNCEVSVTAQGSYREVEGGQGPNTNAEPLKDLALGRWLMVLQGPEERWASVDGRGQANSPWPELLPSQGGA